MSTARISINIDEKVKKDAQAVLSELGLDMTTAVDTFLRALIREQGIPFIIRTEKAMREDQYRRYVSRELEAAKAQAADPNTQWLSHDDVMQKLSRQREARRNV